MIPGLIAYMALFLVLDMRTPGRRRERLLWIALSALGAAGCVLAQKNAVPWNLWEALDRVLGFWKA